jgi:predicted nucleic acid-binding protein
VALADIDDQYHKLCANTLPLLPASPLVTTWPCLTEAMHLLKWSGGVHAQNILWTYLTNGLVTLHLTAADEWTRIYELMNQYADMPLDLADASLVSAAERSGDRQLFSLDVHLRAVRIDSKHYFDVQP